MEENTIKKLRKNDKIEGIERIMDELKIGSVVNCVQEKNGSMFTMAYAGIKHNISFGGLYFPSYLFALRREEGLIFQSISISYGEILLKNICNVVLPIEESNRLSIFGYFAEHRDTQKYSDNFEQLNIAFNIARYNKRESNS